MRPHRLTTKDTDAMTAVCEVCGPVRLASRGRGRWVCGDRKAERRQEWATRHPDGVLANRRVRSEHRLTTMDREARTGACPICGPVAIVPKGRGWMCATRASQLWVRQESSPQELCGDCRRYYLRADEKCPYCSDRRHTDLSYGLKADAAARRELTEAKAWAGGGLGLTIHPATYDTASTFREQTANPDLKTIGAGVPAGVRPEKFIDQWWAQNGHLVGEAL